MGGIREENLQQDIAGIAQAYLQSSRDALSRALDDTVFLPALCDIANALSDCLARGGKILIAGNGGSAADAEHFATELVVRFLRHRPSFAAMALTTNGPLLTAAGNDLGFDQVFARQIEGIGRPGDAFIAISTSGQSPNVLAATKTARRLGLTTIALCAKAGPLAEMSDHALRAPCEETPLIQQVHMAAAHAICLLLEGRLSRDGDDAFPAEI